jgi:uncharacterized protein
MLDRAVLLYAILGVAIGYVSGTFGITGGVITVPILGLLGFDQQTAQGTSLVMQLPTGIVALWQYMKRSRLPRGLVAILALTSAPAAYLGARIAIFLPEHSLRQGFAIFLALLAVFALWSTRRLDPALMKLPPKLVVGVSILGGMCSGLFGVGGATFTIPALTLLFGFLQVESQGLAIAVVLPAIVVGIPTYAIAGFSHWSAGLALGVGAACSVGFGVTLAHRLPEKVLRGMLALLLSVSAFALLAHG